MARKKRRVTNSMKKVLMQKKLRERTREIPVSEPSDSDSSVNIEELLSEAELHVNTFNYELAKTTCLKILEADAGNCRAMEMLASVYIELCEWNEAKVLLLRCVKINPQTGHSKFFSLGQLFDGERSVEFYQRGIKILEKMLEEAENHQPGKDSSETPLNRLLSDAFCSVGEIYMTDCCFKEEAEALCKKFFENGIKADPTNPEPYQCFASFHLVKGNIEEAKMMIKKSMSLWFPQHEAVRDGKESNPQAELAVPMYDSRIKTAKLLIELEMFDDSAKILEGLIEDDDEVVEIWYLCGLLNYMQGEGFKGHAYHYFKAAQEIAAKTGIADAGQMIHVKELMEELGSEYDTDEEDCCPHEKELDEALETFSEDESEKKMES